MRRTCPSSEVSASSALPAQRSWRGERATHCAHVIETSRALQHPLARGRALRHLDEFGACVHTPQWIRRRGRRGGSRLSAGNTYASACFAILTYSAPLLSALPVLGELTQEDQCSQHQLISERRRIGSKATSPRWSILTPSPAASRRTNAAALRDDREPVSSSMVINEWGVPVVRSGPTLSRLCGATGWLLIRGRSVPGATLMRSKVRTAAAFSGAAGMPKCRIRDGCR